MKTTMTFGLLAILLSAASPVFAQEEAIVEHRDGADLIGLEIYTELGIGPHKEGDDGAKLMTYVPRLDVNYWFEDAPFGLALDFPMMAATVDDGSVDESGFYLANPFIAGHFNIEGMLGMLDIGVGLTIPLSSTPSGATDRLVQSVAVLGAMASNGWWDFWIWQPDGMAFALPLRLELDIPGVMAAVDGAIAYMLATGDREDNLGGLQAGAEVGLNLGPVDIGARGQVVYLFTAEGDNAQVSVGPFARMNFEVVFITARALVNLDTPSGTSFVDDGTFWGVHGGLGVNL